MYVMTIPNLDAVWAMSGYNFNIEYVNGSDNKVANTLSHMGKWLDNEAVKGLLHKCLIEEAVKELLSYATHSGIL